MRRYLLGLLAVFFIASHFGSPVRADGIAFDMSADGRSVGTLVVCRAAFALTGQIQAGGAVVCGPAPFVRTGRRMGELTCEDGTVLSVSEAPGGRGLFWSWRGLSGALIRLR